MMDEAKVSETNTGVRYQIAFVDDEEQILRAIRRSLRKTDFDCHYYLSGEELLADLNNKTFDVIVSDMRMPRMDGAQLFNKIKAENNRAIRILLTGHADQQDTIKAINEGGIFRFVSKPWEDEQLLAVIQEGLDIRKLELERDRLLLLTREQNSMLAALNSKLEERVQARTQELQQTADMLDLAYQETKLAVDACVSLLGNSLSKRDSIHSTPSAELAEFVCLMAEELRWEEKTVQDLTYAAHLIDIGKVSFSDDMLNTPLERMSKHQLSEFSKHPIYAETMLMPVSYLSDAGHLLRNHRERWDGRGYPGRLEGKNNPLPAQCLSLSVDFISLVSGSGHREALDYAAAVAAVNKQFAKRYHPDLEKAFKVVAERYQTQYRSRTADLCELDAAVIGRKLSRDLLSKGGLLLVTAGTTIDQRLFNSLKRLQEIEQSQYMLHLQKEKKENDD